jgi:hypothetical protein
MLRPKNICLLCLFLSIATFFSCGDDTGTSINGMNFRMIKEYLSFWKYTGDKYDGLGDAIWIQECSIGIL